MAQMILTFHLFVSRFQFPSVELLGHAMSLDDSLHIPDRRGGNGTRYPCLYTAYVASYGSNGSYIIALTQRFLVQAEINLKK